MSFSLVNTTGWTNGDILTATQINTLDSDHAKAIDGSGGGTYNLSNQLTLGGDVVRIESLEAPIIYGDCNLQGNLVCTQDIHCQNLIANNTILGLNGINVSGEAVFSNTISGRLLEPSLWVSPGIVTMSINLVDYRNITVTTSSNVKTFTMIETGCVANDWFQIMNFSDYNVILTGSIATTMVPHTGAKFVRRSMNVWQAVSNWNQVGW